VSAWVLVFTSLDRVDLDPAGVRYKDEIGGEGDEVVGDAEEEAAARPVDLKQRSIHMTAAGCSSVHSLTWDTSTTLDKELLEKANSLKFRYLNEIGTRMQTRSRPIASKVLHMMTTHSAMALQARNTLRIALRIEGLGTSST
jgi:hypothetical protein